MINQLLPGASCVTTPLFQPLPNMVLYNRNRYGSGERERWVRFGGLGFERGEVLMIVQKTSPIC